MDYTSIPDLTSVLAEAQMKVLELVLPVTTFVAIAWLCVREAGPPQASRRLY